MKKYLFLFFLLFALPTSPQEKGSGPLLQRKNPPSYRYEYTHRHHHYSEHFKHLGGIYLASWVVYPLTQPKTFRDQGSWENYRHHFGQLVFDEDEPFWNWLIHPLSGSQLFLYYRANGYTPSGSLAMTFLSSALFEFTIEIYTEKASIQDLYQTPVLGSLLGFGLEKISLYLLNTDYLLGKIIGHALNPMTLFWFYEGKIKVIPKFNKKSASLTLWTEF